MSRVRKVAAIAMNATFRIRNQYGWLLGIGSLFCPMLKTTWIRVAIHLDNYGRDERRQIIRFFRECVPPETRTEQTVARIHPTAATRPTKRRKAVYSPATSIGLKSAVALSTQ